MNLAIQFFQQPLSSLDHSPAIWCEGEESIRQVVCRMAENNTSAIIVRGPKDRPLGIFTDQDLRKRVVAQGCSLETPIQEASSFPLLTLSNTAPIFEALLLMINHNIKHVALVDASEQVTHIVNHHRLLTAQGQSPFSLVYEIHQAKDIPSLAQLNQQTPDLLNLLFSSGVPTRYISRTVALIADALVKQVLDLTQKEVAPAPVPFAFMVLGSEGRKEQTLKTDQDNALVYADPSPEEADTVHEYFVEFGQKVCGALNEIGYEFCSGEVMAQNPQWCQPLSIWKQYFTQWIRTPEPESVMQSTIFFDFRAIYDVAHLTSQLRQHLQAELKGLSERYFYHLAVDALKNKSPLNWWGGWSLEAGNSEDEIGIDLKQTMTMLVDYARLLSLKIGVMEVNTIERLEQLHHKQALLEADLKNMETAFDFLMHQRLHHQLDHILHNQAPHNYLIPDDLSKLDARMLKDAAQLSQRLKLRLRQEFVDSHH